MRTPLPHSYLPKTHETLSSKKFAFYPFLVVGSKRSSAIRMTMLSLTNVSIFSTYQHENFIRIEWPYCVYLKIQCRAHLHLEVPVSDYLFLK